MTDSRGPCYKCGEETKLNWIGLCPACSKVKGDGLGATVTIPVPKVKEILKRWKP